MPHPTSFISEHTAEYYLLADLMPVLSKLFKTLIPFYFWSGREGSNISLECSEGAKYQVSTEGGTRSDWGATGAQLYFMNLVGALMSVDLDRDDGLEIGSPQKLFTLRNTAGTGYPYGVLPDGQSLVINRLEESKTPDHMILVQNWLSRLPQ